MGRPAIVFEGSSHFAFVEGPEKSRGAVNEFIDSIL
jgi:pimeloyl-ACP methyl ester carboxylesterase